MDKYKFGDFIYHKRKEKGLTQEELGRKLGVTNKAVSKWEVGETMPDITMLEPLASTLGVTIDELLTQKEVKVEEKKNKKINIIFIILLIVLFCAEILTLSILLINKNNSTKEKEKIIELTTDNFNDYININPVNNIISDNQKIMIYSNFELNNNYYLKEKITFDIIYSIDYYFYYQDNTIGVITYFDRISSIEYNLNQNEVINILELQPKQNINEFKGFYKVIIDYQIININGNVYYTNTFERRG